MSLIANLLQPYIAFILGAAFNLQQTLEGLGFHGSNSLSRDALRSTTGVRACSSRR